LSIRLGSQVLIHLIADVVIDEPHGAIAEEELNSASMFGFESPRIVVFIRGRASRVDDLSPGVGASVAIVEWRDR